MSDCHERLPADARLSGWNEWADARVKTNGGTGSAPKRYPLNWTLYSPQFVSGNSEGVDR